MRCEHCGCDCYDDDEWTTEAPLIHNHPIGAGKSASHKGADVRVLDMTEYEPEDICGLPFRNPE
jgi:hypothetical protein